MVFYRPVRRLCAAALLLAAAALPGCFQSLSTSGAAAPLVLRPEIRSLDTGKPLGLHLVGTARLKGGKQEIPNGDAIRFDIADDTRVTFDVKVMLLPGSDSGGARTFLADPQGFSLSAGPPVRVTTQAMDSGVLSAGWVPVRDWTDKSYPKNHPAQVLGRLFALLLAHLVVSTDGEAVTSDRAFFTQVSIVQAEIFTGEPESSPGAGPSRVVLNFAWPTSALMPPPVPPQGTMPEGAPPAL